MLGDFRTSRLSTFGHQGDQPSDLKLLLDCLPFLRARLSRLMQYCAARCVQSVIPRLRLLIHQRRHALVSGALQLPPLILRDCIPD
ncbi:uncharacterized protein SCHCODRAFT_02620879 [Schizophyllum commune H4-8]|uniref:uncharacterized protein n=1 Tax=Schizophyllum commune (strain H4-8 / FGSC 9210) TaxID=578458 RepID=UPI00215FE782|nr:uncharacterized protein SCHCODRAFT_02620879 [Schizophyllum commune H4-8]KAI5893105.1 hypothetical protein SCHCODRAFT_02620879 [Schizophyllum commune H4-8]